MPCPQVDVNGLQRDFVKEADPYRSWIRIINLHFTNQTAGMVGGVLSGVALHLGS